jgi:acyl dehydratase
LTKYFEDLIIGEIARFGRCEVMREEVIEFASRYDPQMFHLDDQAASTSVFGKLAASGWHTCAMVMRMTVDYWKDVGLAESSLGGMGMDELRWPRPVYPGDVLRCEIEALEKIESRSRPEMGIVKSRWSAYNQNEELVMTMISTGMFRRRSHSA